MVERWNGAMVPWKYGVDGGRGEDLKDQPDRVILISKDLTLED
jgi:hypothetical protein